MNLLEIKKLPIPLLKKLITSNKKLVCKDNGLKYHCITVTGKNRSELLDIINEHLRIFTSTKAKETLEFSLKPAQEKIYARYSKPLPPKKQLTPEELEELKIKRSMRQGADVEARYELDLPGEHKRVYLPENIKLMPHQKRFLKSFMNNKRNVALLYHTTGAGKTITGVVASMIYLNKYPKGNVIFIAPPSLINNFKTTLLRLGIPSSFPRYDFYSFEKFARARIRPPPNSKTLAIIDEAHNLKTPISTHSHEDEDDDGNISVSDVRSGKRALAVIQNIGKYADKIIMMTATPMTNSPRDLINLFMIAEQTGYIPKLGSMRNGGDLGELFKNTVFFKSRNPFAINNLNENLDDIRRLARIFDCFISYYDWRNDPENKPNFPNERLRKVFIPYQIGSKTLALSRYLRDRIGRPNPGTYDPFPTQKLNDYYKKIYQVEALPDDTKKLQAFYNAERRAGNTIGGAFNPKIMRIADFIERHKDDKILIFASYINLGVVAIFRKMLKRVNIQPNEVGFITGEISMTNRNKIVESYNSDQIKYVFISKAGGEGLDMKGTKFIIICEPQWNEAIIRQMYGRGIRYKSHVGYSYNTVTVYELFSYDPEVDKVPELHKLFMSAKKFIEEGTSSLSLNKLGEFKQKVIELSELLEYKSNLDVDMIIGLNNVLKQYQLWYFTAILKKYSRPFEHPECQNS